MELDVGVSLYCTGKGCEIEVTDKLSRTRFLRISLTPEDFTAALGCLAEVPGKADIRGADKLGLQMEHKKLEFPLSRQFRWGKCSRQAELVAAAKKTVRKYLPKGWEADDYYGAQETFFRAGDVEAYPGQRWVRVTIRRWVKPAKPVIDDPPQEDDEQHTLTFAYRRWPVKYAELHAAAKKEAGDELRNWAGG